MTIELFVSAATVVASVYAVAGLTFAVAFLWRGVERIDPAANGASFGFRCIVLPGVVAFWPLLALRWSRGATRPPTETNEHRRAASEGSEP